MIELKNVSFGWKKNEDFLRGINLKIDDSKITMIVGPNGAGKSTLVRIAAGILSAHGSVFLDEIDSKNLSNLERAEKIAYIPQFHDFLDISVFDLVLSGRFPHTRFPHKYCARDKKIAQESIARLNLESISEKNLSEISGGQRQKAFLAMALCQNAKNLVFDEPLNSLDIRQQLEFLQTLKELAQEKRAILLVVHDLPIALSFADDLIIISEGKIAGAGNPEKLAESGAISKVFGVRSKKNGGFWQFSL